MSSTASYGFGTDGADAAAPSFGARVDVDVEMVSTNITTAGEQLPRSGRLSRARWDDAVLWVLRIKLRVGLFERPFADESKEVLVPAPTDRASARKVAGRSMVLLHNENGALPLARGTARIAVVRPLGDDTRHLHGPWTTGKGNAVPAVSVLEGIRAAAPSAEVTFTRGCGITEPDTSGIPSAVASDAGKRVVVAPRERASAGHLGMVGFRDGTTRGCAGSGGSPWRPGRRPPCGSPSGPTTSGSGRTTRRDGSSSSRAASKSSPPLTPRIPA